MNNQQDMSPELRAECEAVFAHWKTKGLYDEAFGYCLIEQRTDNPELKKRASFAFQFMYDAAVSELGLTPVMASFVTEEKPKYTWRNGARVRV